MKKKGHIIRTWEINLSNLEIYSDEYTKLNKKISMSCKNCNNFCFYWKFLIGNWKSSQSIWIKSKFEVILKLWLTNRSVCILWSIRCDYLLRIPIKLSSDTILFIKKRPWELQWSQVYWILLLYNLRYLALLFTHLVWIRH